MERYAVRVTCKDGTQRMNSEIGGTYWEPRYHTITWTVEETLGEAERVRQLLFAGDPSRREISSIVIEREGGR